MSVSQGVSPGGAAKRVRILVADDQPVNRKLTMRRLEKLGFAVDVVTNGREALEAMSRTSYDLVLMDCHMPDMDGFQATQELRRREATGPRTPVIALTASVTDRDREQCLAAGMDDFITKPVSEADLIRILSQWVLDKRPAIEAGTINVLQQIGDSDSVVNEVIGIYLDDAPSRIAAIRESIDRRDPILLAAAAHALKSSSGNVGATHVRDICSELEQIGRGGAIAGAAGLVRQLESEYQRAEQALRGLQQR